MYAVIKSGARQYRVETGDTVTIDLVNGGEAKVGDKITFDQVLLVGGGKTVVGAPFVSGAKVLATVKANSHNPKVTIFKYKRRKNYKRWRGHKQPVTVVEINSINA